MMPKLIATDLEEMYLKGTSEHAATLFSRRYDDGTKRVTVECYSLLEAALTHRFDTITDARAWLSINGYRLWA